MHSDLPRVLTRGAGAFLWQWMLAQQKMAKGPYGSRAKA